MRPEKLNILGKDYQIIYCDKPSDVDPANHYSYFGNIDYWTSTIRIYSGTGEDEIRDTIIHEVLHGLVHSLRIKTIQKADDQEDVVSLLAMGLSDFLVRNDWLKNV